jgi:hypothetical protein
MAMGAWATVGQREISRMEIWSMDEP